ncbi:MAG: PEP-CTERM sorting domain-containing protein [Planctomycetia bacterium]|nr:PEP-CTERM sorting domain-containing protein [Planctomycetia bacterium]
MKKVQKYVFTCVCLCLCMCSVANAQITSKGTTLSGLMGKDVTNPTDSISVPGNYNSSWGDYYKEATWKRLTSSENTFGSTECPANLFGNSLGGSVNKWYASFSPTEAKPNYVTVQFPEAFVMTHFTLSSGNDSMGSRNPKNWTVYGSNDGSVWTPIYHSDTTDDFTGNTNTTVLFSSFTKDTISSTVLNSVQQTTVLNSLGDTNPTINFNNDTAYSWYKLEVTKTNNNDRTQLGEWEIYGNVENNAAILTKNNGLVGNIMSKMGAVYHLDAQNAASLTTTEVDGVTKVTAWNDPNGVSFTSREEGSTPDLSTLTINGKDFVALDFSATDAVSRGGDYLMSADKFSAQTVFFLTNLDSAGNLAGIWGKAGDNGIRAENGFWQKGGNFGSNSEFSYNGYTKEEFQAKGSNLVGETVLSQATNTGSVSYNGDNVIGAYFYNGKHDPRPLNGKLAEVMVFNRKLSDWENKFVNTQYALKYGMEIANTLDIFPTGTTATTSDYNKELIGLINKTDSENGREYLVSNSGEGGLAISGVKHDKTAANAFDIFGQYTYPTAGTEIYVLSNNDGSTAITLNENVAGIKFSEYTTWGKEWYVSNLSLADVEDFDLMLTFNSEDAGIDLSSVGDAEWMLIYRETADGLYSGVGELDAQAFTDNLLSFTLSSGQLATGFYTLGIQTTPEVPEPTTWALLVLGVAGIMSVRRFKK